MLGTHGRKKLYPSQSVEVATELADEVCGVVGVIGRDEVEALVFLVGH